MTLDPKTLERLSAYLDDALNPHERAAVEELLSRDVEARKALEGLAALRKGLKDLPPATPPDSFYARVWRDIDAAPSRRPFWRYAPVKALGALAATALVVVATHDIWRSPDLGRKKMSELAQEAPSPLQMFQESLSARQTPRSAPVPSTAISGPHEEIMAGSGAASGSFGRLEREQESAPAAARALGAVAPPSLKKTAQASPAPAAPPTLPTREKRAVKDEPLFLREWSGDWSGIAVFETVVVRDPKEWIILWARHAPGTPAPAVDFSRHMAVALFAGEKPTGGHAARILSIVPEEARLRVSYRLSSPERDAMTIQVLTSPFHVVVVPRSDFPARFEPQ